MNLEELRDAQTKNPSHPKAHHSTLTRLTERGDGFNLFGHVTEASLEEMLAEGGALYFANVVQMLERHDRIIFTAKASTAEPQHGTMIVTGKTTYSVAVGLLTREVVN